MIKSGGVRVRCYGEKNGSARQEEDRRTDSRSDEKEVDRTEFIKLFRDSQRNEKVKSKT